MGEEGRGRGMHMYRVEDAGLSWREEEGEPLCQARDQPREHAFGDDVIGLGKTQKDVLQQRTFFCAKLENLHDVIMMHDVITRSMRELYLVKHGLDALRRWLDVILGHGTCQEWVYNPGPKQREDVIAALDGVINADT